MQYCGQVKGRDGILAAGEAREREAEGRNHRLRHADQELAGYAAEDELRRRARPPLGKGRSGHVADNDTRPARPGLIHQAENEVGLESWRRIIAKRASGANLAAALAMSPGFVSWNEGEDGSFAMDRAISNQIRRAVNSFNAGRHDEARQLCEKAIREKPGDPALNHLLAAILFAEGDIAAARSRWKRALGHGPVTRPPGFLLADCIARRQHADAALVHTRRAVTPALGPSVVLLEQARGLDATGLLIGLVRHGAR